MWLDMVREDLYMFPTLSGCPCSSLSRGANFEFEKFEKLSSLGY